MGSHYVKVSNTCVIVAAILGSMFLSACTPQIPRPEAEQELVPFVLDRILLLQGGSAVNSAPSGTRRWADAPADAGIVVWAPPVVPADESGIRYVDDEQAYRVWWYADQHLVEVTDKQEAIRQFRQTHFSSTSSSNKGWSYIEFGILSFSRGNREAKVYVGISCGPLCGNGTVYTLQRNDSGTWDVKDSEGKWIS